MVTADLPVHSTLLLLSLEKKKIVLPPRFFKNEIDCVARSGFDHFLLVALDTPHVFLFMAGNLIILGVAFPSDDSLSAPFIMF